MDMVVRGVTREMCVCMCVRCKYHRAAVHIIVESIQTVVWEAARPDVSISLTHTHTHAYISNNTNQTRNNIA